MRGGGRQKSAIGLGEDTHLLMRSSDNLSAFIFPTDSDIGSNVLPPPHPPDRMASSTMTCLSSIFGSFCMTKEGSQQERKSVRMRVLFPTENATQVNFLWAICYLLVIVYSILILVGPIVLTWIVPKDEWCGLSETSSTLMSGNGGATANGIDDDGEGRRLLSGDFTVKESSAEHSYANPDYIMDPCRYLRVPELLYVTLEECDMSRRLLCSVILGGIIGYERRSADRPAGIRTMGLVSLGACSFTISSIMAFKSSTMGWDASRVTAALPSGVGFLGGALIWKGSIFVHDEEVHQVHGLTTAASLWLSAAVGVGIGGALYLVTTYVVIIVVAILRYAPKSYSLSYLDEEEEEEEEEKEEEEYDEQEEEKEPKMPEKSRFGAGPWLGGENVCNTDETDYSEKGERAAHLPETKQGSSLRRRSTSERSSVPQSNQRARSVRNLVPTFAE